MANTFVGDNDHGDVVPPTDVLLQMINFLREDIVHFANELNEVTTQRDEARRDLCDMYTRTQPTGCQMKAEDYAKDHGWDCFKEGNTNV